MNSQQRPEDFWSVWPLVFTLSEKWVSIIAAFPVGMVIILIIASFIKDGRKFIDNKEEAVDMYEDEVEIDESVTENEEIELKLKD